ncbi:hypothetical protein BDR04DRAFT_1233742 [Suillus decipiens]|nr:hypothetical protein BDR04DRAFT_1233742 [Suillus decipiens]
MDDDSAEIELLEQNLNKTHQISQRMTSILTNFDTRLVKLEKSILPLYNSTQKLKQRAHNIDRALLKIDEVASSQDGIAVEEGLVLRGPQLGQLEAYIDILERLNAAIAFKSSDADSRDMARLIETGAKKLTQLYTKLVAEGSSGSPPVSVTRRAKCYPWYMPPKLSRVLADLKLAAAGKGGDLSVSLADITISTVQYLNRIPDVQDAVGSALSTLGDGNWKMGDGKQVGKTPKSNPVDVNEKVLIQHFVYDVMNTIIGSLTTLSRTQRRPPFGSVFLLNNISHLVSHLVLRPTNPNTPSLLSKPTSDFLTSSWRTAKAGYFDANFSPLMQTLADDARDKTSGSGWKAAAKEKFTRFYDLLEEVGERHRIAKVLEDDSEERSAVGEEVVRLVVPSLQRFMQKQKEKEFSKNPQKYIKLSPEEVESRIRNFYN